MCMIRITHKNKAWSLIKNLVLKFRVESLSAKLWLNRHKKMFSNNHAPYRGIFILHNVCLPIGKVTECPGHFLTCLIAVSTSVQSMSSSNWLSSSSSISASLLSVFTSVFFSLSLRSLSLSLSVFWRNNFYYLCRPLLSCKKWPSNELRRA